MPDTCELCRSDVLQSVYTPERSTRNIQIHICAACGLVQSLPRADRAPRSAPAVSGGADWGNVRYGKGFRTKIAIDAVARHCDLAAPFTVLDVGSNRGSFVQALLGIAPQVNIVAVEPDERVAASCAGLDRTQLHVSRIEDTPLETARFDIVHSCHTIEHLARPARALRDHWRTLKDGGLLILDAPNIAIIGSDDIVEEWFIDKHLYHFSQHTLSRMVEACGFSILEAPVPADSANLFIVARKNGIAQDFVADSRQVAQHAHDLIVRYVASRARNLTALTLVAADLVRMAPRKPPCGVRAGFSTAWSCMGTSMLVRSVCLSTRI